MFRGAAPPVAHRMTDSTPDRAGAVTRLLHDADGTDLAERLLPLVYDELRAMAHVQRRKRSPSTLDTTALVHEAYLRLVGHELIPNRRYFFAAAARAMRNVLVDHARRYASQKRGRPSTFDPEAHADGADLEREAARVLDVHTALERLAAFDARAAQVVECRFFGGLSVEETAEAVQIGEATVKRDWRRAKAWLHTQLDGHLTADDLEGAAANGNPGWRAGP